MSEIQPVKKNSDVSSSQVSDNNINNSKQNTFTGSIFNQIDRNQDRIISAEEAREYGFNAFEINENITEDKFLSKLNTFNTNMKRQNKISYKPTVDVQGNEMKEIDGVLMFKYPPLYKEFYPIEKALKEHENDEELFSLRFNNSIIKNIDFSKYPEILSKLKFSKTTFDKSCKFPEGYNPAKVMELGQDPGLNVRAMHKSGVTGKGVRIAIIDTGLNPHENYNESIIHYEEMDGVRKNPAAEQHGTSVASIAVGKKTGVAPDAKTYYFASSSVNQKNDHIQALKKIIEINKTLPDSEKIRIVSISADAHGGEEAQLIEELKKQGIWVITSAEFKKSGLGYLNKKDSMENPNNFSNYTRSTQAIHDNANLFVNSGDRTLADPNDSSSYRHDGNASMSWSIPYVAGLYACACQAKPDITPEEFLEAARKTAQKTQDKRLLTSKDAKDEVMCSGWRILLKQTAKELYPDIPFEALDNDKEKQQAINDYLDKEYGKNLDSVVEKLSQPYLEEQIKSGKMDRNYNYTPPKYDEATIGIIDAKALMDYLQKQ